MNVRQSYSFLKILTGSDLANRRLPVISAISSEPGPVVWLTACSHGDEVGGIAVIHDVFKRLQRQLLRGAVHAFPLMNPIGFESGTRNITISREDLNRSFPGGPLGSLGERIAHRIFNRLLETKPNLVLDLHNDWIRSIPYTLLDPPPGPAHAEAYATARALAPEAGLCVIAETEPVVTALSYNLLLAGIPALTLELGEPRVVNEAHVGSGVEAIWNLLARLDMIAPPREVFRYPLPAKWGNGAILDYADRPYGSRSGIIRFLVEPGTEIKAGQPFARIMNAFGKHQETVKAARDGLVLGHSDSAAVFPGMPIMAFGVRPEAFS
jgi:predicted deacylase